MLMRISGFPFLQGHTHWKSTRGINYSCILIAYALNLTVGIPRLCWHSHVYGSYCKFVHLSSQHVCEVHQSLPRHQVCCGFHVAATTSFLRNRKAQLDILVKTFPFLVTDERADATYVCGLAVKLNQQPVVMAKYQFINMDIEETAGPVRCPKQMKQNQSFLKD